MRTTRVGLLAVLAAGALGASALAIQPASAQPNSRHEISGSRPAWQSNPAFAKTGTVPGAKPVTAKVWLAPNDSAGLATLARSVSDPASTDYGHYLTHAQYVAQFAPSAAQVAGVEHWLSAEGLKVTSVGADNHYLAVSGTAAAASAAFGTTLSTYRFDGSIVQAPDSVLSVPAGLPADVVSVTGLTPAGHRVQPASSPDDLGAPPGFANPSTCSAYYGQKKATTLPRFEGRTLPYAVCGYTPAQFRSVYGISGTHLNGAGQTVAVVDAFDSSELASDASTYATRHGDPALTPGQFSDISFPEGASSDSSTAVADCGGNGWYGEQTLDVEAVHGMATGANVEYAGAASCYDDDLLAALSKVVSVDKASIVSNSWGEPTLVANDPAAGCTTATPCETVDQSLINAYETVFEQGAAQGIGFYFSSGDEGDEGADAGYIHPDYPAGDPLVTAVGGTALGVNKDSQREFETGWGTEKYTLSKDASSWDPSSETWLYGAGGGYSQVLGEPSYQKGVVHQDPTGGRAVPDIAMDADPTTGMLVGETQDFAQPSAWGPAGVHYGEYRVGGTSLASPLLAGVQAVAQQGAQRHLGFANPLIYQLARGNSPFFDPTPAAADPGNVRVDFANSYNPSGGLTDSVRTFDQDASLTTSRGWDDVTGVGTVTGGYLAAVTSAAHGGR